MTTKKKKVNARDERVSRTAEWLNMLERLDSAADDQATFRAMVGVDGFGKAGLVSDEPLMDFIAATLMANIETKLENEWAGFRIFRCVATDNRDAVPIQAPFVRQRASLGRMKKALANFHSISRPEPQIMLGHPVLPGGKAILSRSRSLLFAAPDDDPTTSAFAVSAKRVFVNGFGIEPLRHARCRLRISATPSIG